MLTYYVLLLINERRSCIKLYSEGAAGYGHLFCNNNTNNNTTVTEYNNAYCYFVHSQLAVSYRRHYNAISVPMSPTTEPVKCQKNLSTAEIYQEPDILTIIDVLLRKSLTVSQSISLENSFPR